MPYRYLAVCCVLLLVAPPPLRAGAQQSMKQQTIKERISLMAGGSVVEVKLIGKHRPKVKGRLGTITDTVFEVQHVAKDKLTTESIRYDEVKSVRTVASEAGWGRTTNIVVGGLAGAGVLVVVLIIVAASQNWGS